MAGVATMSETVKHKVSSLRECGDRINDAVNMWSEAPTILDGAWLPFDALGIAGEEARYGAGGYEASRKEAMGRLNEATNGLIGFREAVYQVADKYAGVEQENIDTAQKAGEGLTHRPDI
jgi:hypothetical protein